MVKTKLTSRIIFITALVLVSLYIVYACFFFVMQRHFYFPGMHVHRNILANPPADCKRIWIECDGYKVESWFFRPQTAAADRTFPVIIMAHGNGEIIDFWSKRVQALRGLGIGVLLVEYPGYGRSGGEPSYESITKAFTRAYDMLITMPDVDAQRIIVFGFSLGGGAACALAEQRDVRVIILLSTFASLYDMALHYWLPPFIVLDPFDNAKVLKHFKGPSLILHAPEDTIIPFHQAEILAHTAQSGKLTVLRGGHNDQVKDWPLFWQTHISRFLLENGIITLK